MEKPIVIFTECPVLGGYTLTVRDNWNFKLKQVSITAAEKMLILSISVMKLLLTKNFLSGGKILITKILLLKKSVSYKIACF